MFCFIKSKDDFAALYLPTMIFNNIIIKTTHLVKFLDVIVDENLSPKNQVEIIKNEISKHIGVFTGLVIYLISEAF